MQHVLSRQVFPSHSHCHCLDCLYIPWHYTFSLFRNDRCAFECALFGHSQNFPIPSPPCIFSYTRRDQTYLSLQRYRLGKKSPLPHLPPCSQARRPPPRQPTHPRNGPVCSPERNLFSLVALFMRVCRFLGFLPPIPVTLASSSPYTRATPIHKDG